MPILRKELKDVEERSIKERILGLLESNKDLAWTYKEIAEKLDAPIGSVTSNLSQLVSEGKVEHKGNYWLLNVDYKEERIEGIDNRISVSLFIHDNALNSPTNWANNQGVVRWTKSQEIIFRKLFDEDYKGVEFNGNFIGKPKPDFSFNRRIPVRGLRGNKNRLEISRGRRGYVIIMTTD